MYTPTMTEKRQLTSLKLSPATVTRLAALCARHEISKTAAIERAVREWALREGVSVEQPA